MEYRRVYAKIDLDALDHNVSLIEKKLVTVRLSSRVFFTTAPLISALRRLTRRSSCDQPGSTRRY